MYTPNEVGVSANEWEWKVSQFQIFSDKGGETCVSGRHSRNIVRHQFFPRRFAPSPCLLLKFGHMIDLAYIYHVSKFQQQTRSRDKTSGKKLLQETP